MNANPKNAKANNRRREQRAAEAAEKKAKADAEAAAEATANNDGDEADTKPDPVETKPLTAAEKKVKAAKQRKIALEREAKRHKKEAKLKERAKKEGFEYRPPKLKVSNYKDVAEGESYEFVPQHGRFKHDGELYEPGDKFTATATPQFVEFVKKGILFVTELGEFDPRADEDDDDESQDAADQE